MDLLLSYVQKGGQRALIVQSQHFNNLVPSTSTVTMLSSEEDAAARSSDVSIRIGENPLNRRTLSNHEMYGMAFNVGMFM